MYHIFCIHSSVKEHLGPFHLLAIINKAAKNIVEHVSFLPVGTLRFHFTPVRMAKIKNSGDSRCWREYGERGTLLHCWWDCKQVQALWKSRASEDPAIPLLGIYPEYAQTCNKHTCSTMFIAALFIIARTWKEPRCPSTEKWILKMWYIYTMEYHSAIKKNEFMKFLGKWMDLEGIILSEVT